jgi:hypothetical protein
MTSPPTPPGWTVSFSSVRLKAEHSQSLLPHDTPTAYSGSSLAVAKLDALAIAVETGEIPQNVNFAIRAESAKAILSANSVEFTIPAVRKAMSAENLAELLQASTAFVLCQAGR